MLRVKTGVFNSQHSPLTTLPLKSVKFYTGFIICEIVVFFLSRFSLLHKRSWFTCEYLLAKFSSYQMSYIYKQNKRYLKETVNGRNFKILFLILCTFCCTFSQILQASKQASKQMWKILTKQKIQIKKKKLRPQDIMKCTVIA